ncbi:AKR_HP2_G0004860.mRNA.1.CDS.1 [Saccharomyces cerevisiae]|nr:AKR_HP2_G0004860.mRNA.1.CDS.1 [Saccharomyces cerevisiae]CAI6410944.1 AKR_HP2_G0004860.mRNA.1.CDS.1 [Saccharomyces cerevisiae]
MSIARQSCDCCRVRRVKCDRNKPCSRCHQRNLNCTYLRPLKKRGPKSIRAKSLRKIAEVQMVSMNSNIMVTPVALMKVPKKVIEQCLRLYQDNLYVIWPMLSYDDLHKLLEEKYDDCYTYCFLVSLSAATLSELQTEIRSEEGVPFTGEQLCSLCMLSRQFIDDLSNSDIFRNHDILYCLHRCYAQFCGYENFPIDFLVKLSVLSKWGDFIGKKLMNSFPSVNSNSEGKDTCCILPHVVASLDAIVAPPLPEIVTDPRLSLEIFLEVIRVLLYQEKSLRRIWNELHTVSLAVKTVVLRIHRFSVFETLGQDTSLELVSSYEKALRMNFLSPSASRSRIPVKIARTC